MAEVISIKDVSKQYETEGHVITTALKNINLSICAGEFVAIMGPSGSGKSTFMNILGCLDIPTLGTYHLNNENVGSLNKNQLAYIRNAILGFVFQGFNLLQRRSAINNVELPLLYADVPKSKRDVIAKEMLKKVGLAHRENSMPNQLSGGEQQRVAIARAIANNPKVILADEPTGNLDTATSVEIMNIFTSLNKELGITVVLVTHEPDIAQYAERLVRFKDGEIIEDSLITEKIN